MKIHRLAGYIQNIYLVEYPTKLLLLDGCCRADVDTVYQFITEHLNRPMTDLKLIVVTHMHPDHAGGAYPLRKLSGAKIAASNAPGQWYQGLDGLLMHLTDMALAWWVAGRLGKKRQNLWYNRHLTPDYYLATDAQLPYFEEWQAIHSPGHTDRDICLYHSASESIYIADLLVKVKGELMPPFPIFYPRRYLNSLLMLKTLQPKKIMFAHSDEMNLAEINFATILDAVPETPMTHWRSVKAKARRALGFKRSSLRR
ncbi:MBL fold metallo-hydrolase [Pseudoalteromonas mariniglutinosa]|uniref:MBL fold metallo-hydrolase n=1 Tax=Pseudoalteromonas mariniglutinosa TaxID=206042 RepID=UPI00384E3DE5